MATRAKKPLRALELSSSLRAHRGRAALAAREEAARRGVDASDDFAIWQYYWVFILKYGKERQDRELESAHTRVLLHRIPEIIAKKT